MTDAGDDDARSAAEAARLEALWAGEFGDQYVERNRVRRGQPRAVLGSILDRTQPPSRSSRSAATSAATCAGSSVPAGGSWVST